MMNQYQGFSKIKGSLLLSAIIFAIAISLFVGCNEQDNSEHPKDMKIQQEAESIIREGEIDLNTIDINKDGKVFQDPMHWNVISDKAGDCPLCNMKLEEVSLNEAKMNLTENGFKVK
ncbi:MAG: hypothetical protein KIT33_10355 [Candidatus Kapabacteria bacterium]|nr:hypothetical protein [Ignavibacteriota bacterium]MCW5885360.1 hypothetical protein [Candidatus Kapabacteria bacterium]